MCCASELPTQSRVEAECFCSHILIQYIYIIYTPILASSASVLGCEREQGRFKQAREGAARRAREGAKRAVREQKGAVKKQRESKKKQ
jgi:hypothetical protein